MLALFGNVDWEVPMTSVPLNEPARVAFSGQEEEFEHLLDAVQYAFESCPEGERNRLVVFTESGRRLDWHAVEQLYQEHLTGP